MMNVPILSCYGAVAAFFTHRWYQIDTILGMAMTLRLTAEQDRALTLLARAQNCSKQEAAIRAIVSAAARTLVDDQITQLAQHIIPTQAALSARIRRARNENQQ